MVAAIEADNQKQQQLIVRSWLTLLLHRIFVLLFWWTAAAAAAFLKKNSCQNETAAWNWKQQLYQTNPSKKKISHKSIYVPI